MSGAASRAADHRPLVVLASRNPGKLRELAPLLEAHGWTAVDLATLGVAEQPEEDELEVHDTFEANALAKARYFAERLPGRAVLADDSGLAVEALGGAPGVRSKRWAARPGLHGPALDAANNARLVAAMRGVTDRRAQFVCAAAWVAGDVALVERGTVAGRIVDAPVGAEGFGYDPYFWSDELGATFADRSREAKAAVSHRGRAVRALLARVAALGGGGGRG